MSVIIAYRKTILLKGFGCKVIFRNYVVGGSKTGNLCEGRNYTRNPINAMFNWGGYVRKLYFDQEDSYIHTYEKFK